MLGDAQTHDLLQGEQLKHQEDINRQLLKDIETPRTGWIYSQQNKVVPPASMRVVLQSVLFFQWFYSIFCYVLRIQIKMEQR